MSIGIEIAPFEASVLVRCTGVCGGGRTRVLGGARVRTATVGDATATGAERAPTGFEAEFSRARAAHRLVELLEVAGRPAAMDSYTAGNRHRYDIHRVTAPSDVTELLRNSWFSGYGELCGQPVRQRTTRQVRHALALAGAAWRAALLVAGPTRSDAPGLRLPDLETAAALVRAGRMLDVSVRMTTRPGGQLVLVLPVGAPRLRLTEMLAEMTVMSSAA